ncbi:T9SS type A sorting domain-containing protein [Aestuariibaculum sp. M13]|uniref:T9SS type A sorting domain-containing protein n=1 Tax=Aestuariibaculum sp. M13 TaxID=2967132 RepID=UPI00215A0656|nr:T9SS type A sorting domain-containing protein [Aestuariibaculum sp. M13]MCR8666906.1 T9SS type A sorting domain-containing protein [Aestuariibaculum sp. M13]
MKKLYFLFITLLITSLSFGQIEIFNVAGGGTLPTGWTSSNPITTNDIDRSSYYLVETDGTDYDIITTNVIDLSAYASAILNLDVATFGSGTNNPAKIEISYDGGTTFTQTEVTNTPSSSTYIEGGPINLSSVSNQVQIRISNNGIANKGVRLRNLVLTAYSSSPYIEVTSPTNNSTFASGTATVDVNFNTGNTSAGDQVNITINGGTTNTNVTSPYSINTTDGESYSVVVELVDSSANILDSQTINFEVLFPCNLEVGAIETTCDTSTSGTDTYTTTIAYTSGATSQYTIDTGGIGVVGGDDPTSVASGTITITGVDEGTDFTVTFTGNPTDSSCDFIRNISSPTCVSVTCANAGDIIFTEVMPNPNAVIDPAGEYFELYNTTSSAIDIQGWIIKDDASSSETHTISSSLVVPANGYIIIGNGATPNGGITMDYTYGNDISLGNSSTDGLILECSTTVIDELIWDGSFPFSAGIAMELSTTAMNSTDNDSNSNWGLATSTFGSGDLGTPGAVNDFTLSNKKFEIAGFNMFPNPTSFGYVNVTAKSTSLMEIAVFDLLGKQVIKQSVSNKLDVSSLKSGVYFMKITQDDAVSTKKLVIK